MLLLAAILTGLITDTAGAPIPNASVEIVNPKGPVTKTDETGHFRFPDLPNPNVQLRIRAVGFATQVRPAAPVIRMEVNLEIPCCYCEEVPPRYKHKRASQSSLKGHIAATRLDDNGEATLTPQSGAPIRLHLAGAGTFEFPNLPPGRYALKIQVPLYSAFEITDLEIPPNTETQIDGVIVLDVCPSWTAPCPTTRTIQRQKPSPPNMVCL